jgi:hypothetical protein
MRQNNGKMLLIPPFGRKRSKGRTKGNNRYHSIILSGRKTNGKITEKSYRGKLMKEVTYTV